MNHNQQTTYLLSSLTGKLRREQSEFRAMLLTQPAPYILTCAQEYVMREKIIACIKCNILSIYQISALLNEKHPLKKIYDRVSGGEVIAIDALIGATFEEAESCFSEALVLEALEMMDSLEDEE